MIESDQKSPGDDAAKQALHRAAEELVLSRSREVLLVEDTAAHAALIRRALNPDVWKVVHVTRASAALTEFERNSQRIVLLDLSLPDGDGLTLLQRLHAINAHAPLIIVTATDQVRTSVEAMQKGAWDYVVKGDPKETSTQLLRALERAWQGRLNQAEQNLIAQTRLVELVRNQRLEAIEVVLRTVCHEVNNPLSGVVALSQLLAQNDRLDSDLKQLAEGITRSAKEVAEVVQKLKSISEEVVVEFGGREILALDAPDDSSDEPNP